MALNENFMQSHEWERYEKMEGYETFWLDGEGYHALAILKQTPIGKYLFCPYGPAIKEKKYLAAALDSLANLARDKEAVFVRVEPMIADLSLEEMKKLRLVKSHDIDPAHTWVIDVSGGEEDVLAKSEKDRVRRWRNHEAHGLKFIKTKEPEKIEVLVSLLEKLGEERKFTPQDKEHLKNQLKAGFGTLYIAEFEGKAVAASLVHDFEDTRYAMHAAADDDYKRLRAGTSLAIEEMVDFNRDGGKWFDFWGITTSEDPNHPWYGFTKYKKSYDGYQVDYAGTWDLPINKIKYQAYKGARVANRIIRKK